MPPVIHIRRMHPKDLAAVLNIQSQCYAAALLESAESFLSKLNASPLSCFSATMADVVVGYLLSLPAKTHQPQPLNSSDCSIPSPPDCLYLHDLAISPDARGQGIAHSLINAYLHQIQQLKLRAGSLTAINNSISFWHGYGFRAIELATPQQQHVTAYGTEAQYMWLDYRY